MLLRTLFLLLLALGVSVQAARAEESSVTPAPFVSKGEEVALPGATLRSLVAARRALELGFPSVAAEIYTRLLEKAPQVGVERDALVLELVTAWLDEGRTSEAERALLKFEGAPSPGYYLREGLIAVRRNRPDLAKSALAAVKAGELPEAERAWWHFLQGQVADAGGDFSKARDAYQTASDVAVSDMQRAYFILARERARLNLGDTTESQLNTLRQNAERYQGRTVGYAYGRQYAALLAARGRTGEAVTFLAQQLQMLPAAERSARDDFRLMMGLVAGAQRVEGRNALEGLLASAGDPTLQRVALHILARDAADAGLFARLNELINAVPAHPILADLLLARAQLGLSEKRVPLVERGGAADSVALANQAQADLDAKALLAKFPGSPLKPAALGLLADLSWEQRRFRSAADYAAQARAELPAGEVKASLGVMVAEAYFRAGDFASAADAYAVALNEVPPGVPAGGLITQRVLAKINGGKLDEAAGLLDEFSASPRMGVVDRWQAEWMLSRALQGAGRDADAYARVNRSMTRAGEQDAVSPALRARMAWLQARLSLETGNPQTTLELAAVLPTMLEGLDAGLRGEVAASTRLLVAKAHFQMGNAEEGLKTLEALRAEFPQTDAAVYSYIDEADHYAENDRLDLAQARLTKLADDFKQHNYAPYALYRAALIAERRGQDQYYEEAYRILEDLVKRYGTSDVVFHARLKQGDLARRLNDFSRAMLTYEYLINNYTYSQQPGVLLAELALAACHRAQITPTDVSHYESALTILERLQDLSLAGDDMRIESGFQLGDLLATSGKAREIARAETVWWTLATTYLLDDARAAKLGPKGRYWLARALLRLGDLRRDRGDLEEARNAYELILTKKLPFSKLAHEVFVRSGGKPRA